MYVIRVSNRTGTTQTVAGIEIITNDDAYFPADRCIWKYFGTEGQEYADGQYDLNRVFFVPGNGDAPISLNTGGLTTTLGVIGKSGRFVGLTA